MSLPAFKYILIPEYAPLYAMRYCYGPLHGPLMEPCKTPIDVIGKLFAQTGKEKVTIYEVLFDPTKRKTISEPVQLTLSNYKLPYEEIANIDPQIPENELTLVPEEEKEVIYPTEVITEEEAPVEEVIEEEVEEVKEEIITETGSFTFDQLDGVEVPDAEIPQLSATDEVPTSTTTTTDPYAGMTKAERKAARAAARAAQMNTTDTVSE